MKSRKLSLIPKLNKKVKEKLKHFSQILIKFKNKILMIIMKSKAPIINFKNNNLQISQMLQICLNCKSKTQWNIHNLSALKINY